MTIADEEDDYEPHPTLSVEVKPGEFADIDVDMVPLVRWLNSIPSVRTHYCCQGDDDAEDGLGKPYLTFTCVNMLDLERVVRFLDPDTRGEIDVYGGHVRYCFRWYDCKRLKQTLDRLDDLNHLPKPS